MKLKRNCIFFNAKLNEAGATPDWEHTLGQGSPLYLMKEPGCSEIINGLVYNSVDKNLFSYGTGGDNYETEIVALFNNVTLKFYNSETKTILNQNLENPFIVILVKQISGTHNGRRMLKFSKSFTYNGISNENFYNEINNILPNPWFGYEIHYDNISSGYLTLTILVDSIRNPVPTQPDIKYITKNDRKGYWDTLVNEYTSNFETGDETILINNHNVRDENISFNKIYFGPPGTGKSHAIKEELKKLGAKADNYSRVTFHPDYDYHSFVGGYKPFTDTEDDDKIKYKFVPQVFTDLYVKAWSNTSEDYYLVIEEINRGNCAEIFGDIFQLLDRNPEYNIEPSSELKAYLKEQENELSKDKTDEDAKVNLLFDGKLQMPNNLSILASMNTSDQSLYPMDSAFKRRWDWHYVPIDLKCTESNFTIKIDDMHQYSWLEFLAKVNDKIYKVNKSEDKQIGNWFINASKSENSISKELFINKVLFYLWNDVFKDEVFNPDNIFIERNTDGTKNRDISFNNFYNKDEQDRLLIHLLSDILNVTLVKSEDKETSEYSQDNQVVNIAAEPKAEEYKENKSESEE
ncbi:AAA family ATPase [Empedobacter falsenii]